MAKRVITFGEIMLRLASRGLLSFRSGQFLWRQPTAAENADRHSAGAGGCAVAARITVNVL